MAGSFSGQINANAVPTLVTVVPQLRRNGMHYEINIKGYPRFNMVWGPLERYDVTEPTTQIPYDIILQVSDLIAHNVAQNK